MKKNVMTSLLGSVGITDPCDDAISIVCCILSNGFPNECIDLSWFGA